jgi:hypothetical protein
MELLSNLNTFQIVLIGIGLLMAAPVIFPVLQQFLSGVVVKKSDTPVPETEDDNDKKDDNESDLTNIIHQWEDLLESCEKNKLDEACKLLEQLFPLLLNARKKESGV